MSRRKQQNPKPVKCEYSSNVWLSKWVASSVVPSVKLKERLRVKRIVTTECGCDCVSHRLVHTQVNDSRVTVFHSRSLILFLWPSRSLYLLSWNRPGPLYLYWVACFSNQSRQLFLKLMIDWLIDCSATTLHQLQTEFCAFTNCHSLTVCVSIIYYMPQYYYMPFIKILDAHLYITSWLLGLFW